MDSRLQRYAGIGGIILVLIAVGSIVAPELVYDRFIWQYLWGPIVADAHNQATVLHNGVMAAPGYTPVSIVVYAALLLYGVALFSVLLDRWRIDIDFRLVLSLVPFMVFGGLLRVVEDASVLAFPWNTLLISPVIYLVLAVSGILLLAVGRSISRHTAEEYHTVIQVGGGLLAVAVLGIVVWAGNDISPMAGWLIGVPAAAIVVGIGVQHVAARFRPDTLLTTAVGTAAVAGQVLDGAVTAVIVSVIGGTEKLPLSAWIIDTFTPAAFPAVKLGVALLFLAAVAKKDEDQLTALMVLVIIAVGLGPGVRNLARALFGI